MSKLENKKVAILVENGFEQIELTSPKKALEELRCPYPYYLTAGRTGKSMGRNRLGRKFYGRCAIGKCQCR